jgi:hypothetical protein
MACLLQDHGSVTAGAGTGQARPLRRTVTVGAKSARHKPVRSHLLKQIRCRLRAAHVWPLDFSQGRALCPPFSTGCIEMGDKKPAQKPSKPGAKPVKK